MIRSRSDVPLGKNRQELVEDKQALFNLFANDGDVHQYIAGQIPAHWHTELEVFALLSGRVRMGIGEQAYDLEPGEGCFINGGVLHSCTAITARECRYRSFVFDASIVAGAPGSAFDVLYTRPLMEEGAPFVHFGPEDTEYFRSFDEAFAACEREEHGFEFDVRAALSRILLMAAERAASSPQNQTVRCDERLKAMLAWIDENLESDVRIEDVAGAGRVCARVCQRMFQRYMHCRPMEYLRQKRLLAAAGRLAATDEPVTDIAMRYGFASPSHFAYQFHVFTGSTPRKYRAQAVLAEEKERGKNDGVRTRSAV